MKLKPINKIATLFLLLFAVGSVASAQDHPAFYRGKEDPGYAFVYNGNPWWENRAYHNGDIFYNGKLYENYKVNINAHRQKLMVLRPGEIIPVELETSLVKWFTYDDRLFVNLGLLGSDAPEGFYEVLYSGDVLLLSRTDKALRHDTRDANGQLIGYYDPTYKPKVASFFEVNTSYYLLKDGALHQIRKKKDLKKLMPGSRKALNKVLNAANPSYAPLDLASYLKIAVPFLDGKPRPFDMSEQLASLPKRSEYTDVRGSSPLEPSTEPAGSLPAGWFSMSGDDETVVKYVSGAVVTAIYQNKVYELGHEAPGKSGPVRVSGFVRDSEDSQPVIGAVVFDAITGNYTTTDATGAWSMDLPLGENTISFSEYTMEDFAVMVKVNDAARLDVVMNPKTEMLESALVSADARAAHRTAAMGVEKLSVNVLRKVPVAFGEGDVLKAVQSLPGVQSVGEASSGINVRGGSTDQNLILYNDNTIYNPSHMFGIFSAFNPDIVENVELYKSSIPVEYGGRISSVMDVSGKNGNFDKFTGKAGIGLLTSHALLETPIVKGKTSLVLGGRTTYSDWMLGLIPENSGYSGGKAAFSDLNVGLAHKASEDNILKINAYWSSDKFSFSGDTTFHYSNFNASMKWIKGLSDSMGMILSAGYDSYSNIVDDTFSSYHAYELTTSIRQAFAKASFKHELSDEHTLSFGVEAIGYIMNPGEMKALGDSSLVVSRSLSQETAVQPSAWLGDSWRINGKLSLDYGVRLSAFGNRTDGKWYAYPEGRISAKYSANENLSFKGGFNSMTQYINLISNSTSMSPMDTWKICDAKIRPQRGWQTAGGAYWTVFGGKVDLSMETYYKRMYHFLDYKSGAVLVMNEKLADDLVETTGKAYGVELMAKKTVGNLTGWVSYTYSRSLLKETSDRGLFAINQGEWYRAPFDKPNDFKFSANYALTHRYSVSMNMDYSTGRPITIPTGHYYYAGEYRLSYSARNAYRIPDYFRMDLSFNVDPGHKLTDRFHYDFTFGVYNVTGRRNAYSVYYTTKGNNVYGHMVSIFAVPVPYATLNLRF